jgi:hypothetical protein
MILEEVIAENLKPVRSGGITMYPAEALERIFGWAEGASRELEWVEGVFYSPATDQGQLSLSYMCERRDEEYTSFRATCLSLVPEIEAEAASNGMGAYFEVGVRIEGDECPLSTQSRHRRRPPLQVTTATRSLHPSAMA